MREPEVSRPKSTPRLAYLDVLRGFAALTVALFHIAETAFHDRFITLRGFFNGGQFGVLLFFIISGLVITASVLRSDSVKEFWVGRFWRLFPLYWASLICSAALFLLFPWEQKLPMYGNLGERFWETFVVNLTMVQHFTGYKHFVVAYWTLSFEMLFYIVLSGLALFKKAEKAYVGVWIVTAYFFLSGLAGWVMNRHMGFQNPSLFGFFCLGVWTYRQSKGLISNRQYLTTVGLFTTGLIFAWYVNSFAMPSAEAIAKAAETNSPIGNLSAYLLAITVFLGMHFWNRQKFSVVWQQLGVVSFSLYLAHTLAIRIAANVFDPSTSGIPFIASAICVTAAMTLMGYQLIEVPCLRKIEKLRRKKVVVVAPPENPTTEQTQVA